ncbi:MAG: hypothetical protein WCG25_08855 [bacterium]
MFHFNIATFPYTCNSLIIEVLSHNHFQSTVFSFHGSTNLANPYKYHRLSSNEINNSIPTLLSYFLITKFTISFLLYLSSAVLFLISLLLVSKLTKFLNVCKSGLTQIINVSYFHSIKSFNLPAGRQGSEFFNSLTMLKLGYNLS